LKDLLGKSVILRTYEAAKNSGLFADVYVVTDHHQIYDEIVSKGGKAILSQQAYETGTDRIAAVAKDIKADIIINIQGDEPFINARSLKDLIQVFKEDSTNEIDMASLMVSIKNKEDFLNPNHVKVVTDCHSFAMYFSRAPIPFSRDQVFEQAWKHIGVYAFRKESLVKIAQLPQTKLEQIEKLENLRFLQNGFKIKMVQTESVNFGIDTPEDLEKAREFLNKTN